MKKLPFAIAISSMLLLGACSSDEEESSQGSANDGEVESGYGTIDHGVDETKAEESKVGFSLSGEEVEEAADVPAEAKEQILAAFDTYIETLNAQDVEAYLATLSDEKYDLDEEREFVKEQFTDFDLNREVSNVTVVKYSDTEAQVFAEIKMSYKQLSSGLESKPNGRQVTVFQKDDGEWKVASVHYIGDE